MNLFTKLSHKPKFFTSGRLLDKTDLVLYRKNIIRKSKELFVTVGFYYIDYISNRALHANNFALL